MKNFFIMALFTLGVATISGASSTTFAMEPNVSQMNPLNMLLLAAEITDPQAPQPFSCYCDKKASWYNKTHLGTTYKDADALATHYRDVLVFRGIEESRCPISMCTHETKAKKEHSRALFQHIFSIHYGVIQLEQPKPHGLQTLKKVPRKKILPKPY